MKKRVKKNCKLLHLINAPFTCIETNAMPSCWILHRADIFWKMEITWFFVIIESFIESSLTRFSMLINANIRQVYNQGGSITQGKEG